MNLWVLFTVPGGHSIGSTASGAPGLERSWASLALEGGTTRKGGGRKVEAA